MMLTGICNLAYWSLNSKASGIINADSAADARIWDGRTAISFGNPSNFFGTDWGPNIFAIKTGHMTRLAIGDTVWQITSPAKGTAGAESANTSARAVG